MLLKTNIPIGYIFGKIKKEIIAVTIYVAVIEILYHKFHFTRISIPIAVPTILGTVISLLLAFKSNQAYDRWWEARTIWGGIVNDSRTLTRQLLSFVDSKGDSSVEHAFCERLAKRHIAWCYVVSRQLRGQNALNGLERFITNEDIEHIKRYSNVAVALLELQGRDIRSALKLGWINEYQQIQIDKTLSAFSNQMGACERIKNTVFPVTYSVYIHLSLILFVSLLPFGLIDIFGLFTIFLVIAIASSFFLIEKMAIHLQDPFENRPTDTPTTTICQTIERDIKQMLKESYRQEEKQTGQQLRKTKMYYIL